MAGRVHIALALVAAVVCARGAYAGSPSESKPPELPPPPTWKGDQIDVVEKLGASVPLDAAFRTHDGARVTLGDVLAGELPTILTFNYSDCPMLCSLQLNGFTAALPGVMEKGKVVGTGRDVAFKIGEQFRIVTISLEPNETLPRIQKMRQKYLERLPEAARAKAAAGWTFLIAETPGDSSQVQRVAAAVGFKYMFLAAKAEWAHPAALIFLSTRGVVTRYVYGIEYEADVLRESIFKAGMAEPSTASGFMHRCYVYDPDENNYSRAGKTAMRIGAAGFVVLMLGGFGFFVLRRARSSRSRTLKEPQL